MLLDIWKKLCDTPVSMPNAPTPTMGGKVWWTTIAEYKGWKLQQNMFSQHCRILDSDDVRIAWGNYEGMKQKFDRLKDNDAI